VADKRALFSAKIIGIRRLAKLGSTVKVTNLKNGRSARVKVTDRGPKVPGRVVDVSKGDSSAIGHD